MENVSHNLGIKIKGHRFSISPKKKDYSKYPLPLEILRRDFKSKSVPSVDSTGTKPVYKTQHKHLITDKFAILD